jgi:hypothetical protein
MAYIGRDTDKISNVEVLDNITFDGSSSYTLQKGGSNFTPSSANTLLLSIDGVVQAGNFTVSGSTIDFGTAVAGTSTCDFVLHYGVGLITAPSDGTVTTAKLADSSVSLAKLTATGTKDATTFLRGDNSFSTLPASGITMADNWRLTVDFTGNGHPISSNLERNDTAPALSYFGSQMSESSGVFTFPSTGIYYVTFNASFKLNGDDRVFSAIIQATTDNSTYANASEASSFIQQTSGSTTYQHIFTDALFDITDTANQKVQFRINGSASLETMANTTRDLTAMRFIRLGDT